MTVDIVTLLRIAQEGGHCDTDIITAAADAIERLRKEVEAAYKAGWSDGNKVGQER